MSTIAVLVDPPRAGLVLSALVEDGPLTPDDAAALYGAMVRDTVIAADTSGGDLLVNYRPDDLLPDSVPEDGSPDAEAEVRALVADALDSLEDVRFEVQVGSSPSARAGNTVTHLLREEAENAVAVVPKPAPFLARTHVDNAAMKLRRSSVVLGPTTGGRVYYAAFAAPVDFTDVLEPPSLPTLATRGRDAGHEVDFIQQSTVVDDVDDLTTFLAVLEARQTAGRIVPAHTAATVAALGLGVERAGDGLAVVRE